MFISPQEILVMLEYYKYLLIFPIAIVEGPIIIVISGFLVYLGFLNIFITYIILVVADSIGDSLYYLIGRYWRRPSWIKSISYFLGVNENSEEFLENHFKIHKGKTLLLAKISHGLGGSVQIAAGIAGVPYLDFICLSLIGTMPKTLILLMIGFYLGKSYVKIDGYFNLIAVVIISIVVLLLLYMVSKKVVKNFLTHN